MDITGREIHLAARPVGEPKATDFHLAEVTVRQVEDGEVLLRNSSCPWTPTCGGG
jgi:NADPH-dependent curcumin reductase CurA